MKKHVLFILHMPPPVHGAAMMGQYIRDSRLLQSRFEGKYINMTTASGLKDIGHVGINKIITYLKMLLHIKNTIKNEKPDIIYLTPNSAGISFYKDFITVSLVKFWSRSCSRQKKINVLIHFHNKGVEKFSNTLLNKWLYKRFFKGLYVLLLSELLYKDVQKYVLKSNVFYCSNGLPLLNKDADDNVRKAQKERINRDGIIHILFLSNMMKDKGVWTLVDACKLLKDNGVRFKCTFVGGWKDISENVFKQRVLELGLCTEVVAVGPKYNNEKEEYWLDADMFCVPSFNECFPLVLLEAMQHALPCISTNEGAISDIIDEDKTGFVVSTGDSCHLAAKIQELAFDKTKRLNMGEAGFEKFMKKYSLGVFEKSLCDVLDQLV